MADTRAQAEAFINALHNLETETGDPESALDQIADLYADDATLTNSAQKLTGEDREGKDAIRQFWSDYKKTFGRAYSDFHQVTTNDTAAGLFWVTRAQNADGQENAVAYDGVTLLVFNEAGKISYFQGYYDTRQLNRQMGVEEK